MEWYNNMAEQQKRDFRKVITVSVVGIFLVLLIPLACMGNASYTGGWI